MNRPRQTKTFEDYFVFFENRSKNVSKFLAWLLLAGLSVNLLLVALISVGVIPRAEPKVQPHTTPIPEPAHFLDVPDNSTANVSAKQGLSPSQ